MIVDFHTHLFNHDVCQNMERYLDDDIFNFLYNNTRSKMVDHNHLLESMKDSSIDYAVAMGFPWVNEKYCEEQNIYFSTINKLTGGKILPFGSVPPGSRGNIEAWVKDIGDKGLFGIGEVAFYADGLNEKNTIYLRNLLDAAQKYSLPVCLHVNEPVGHEYSGKYEPSFTKLYSIITEFPEVTLVLAHWGGGLLFYELMPEVSDAFKNVYYDTAASPFLYRDDIYQASVDIIGSKKILFGTDYPLIKFERYINSIEGNIDDETVKKDILYGNASGILGLQE